MIPNIKDGTVVITGAAGGMGSAFSRRFAEAGAGVALLDLDSDALWDLEKELKDKGVNCIGIVCDIIKGENCIRAMELVIDHFGGIDILINNAGITHRSAFSETDISVFKRVMDVNYFGALYCTKAALKSLVKKKGLIITISSVAGFSPLYGRTGYSASKHALHGLFDSLRSELKEAGVSIMIVCPGFTETGIAKAALDGDGSVTGHPQSTAGKTALPENVAESVFQGAIKGKRLLVLTPTGKISRLVNKLWPSMFERLMVRSLRQELERG